MYRVLGYGFLEKVYQRAMQVELQLRGLNADIESQIRVIYKGHEVGPYQGGPFCQRVRDRRIEGGENVLL